MENEGDFQVHSDLGLRTLAYVDCKFSRNYQCPLNTSRRSYPINIVNLLQNPVRPLHRSRNHLVSPWTPLWSSK